MIKRETYLHLIRRLKSSNPRVLVHIVHFSVSSCDCVFRGPKTQWMFNFADFEPFPFRLWIFSLLGIQSLEWCGPSGLAQFHPPGPLFSLFFPLCHPHMLLSYLCFPLLSIFSPWITRLAIVASSSGKPTLTTRTRWVLPPSLSPNTIEDFTGQGLLSQHSAHSLIHSRQTL